MEYAWASKGKTKSGLLGWLLEGNIFLLLLALASLREARLGLTSANTCVHCWTPGVMLHLVSMHHVKMREASYLLHMGKVSVSIRHRSGQNHSASNGAWKNKLVRIGINGPWNTNLLLMLVRHHAKKELSGSVLSFRSPFDVFILVETRRNFDDPGM